MQSGALSAHTDPFPSQRALKIVPCVIGFFLDQILISSRFFPRRKRHEEPTLVRYQKSQEGSSIHPPTEESGVVPHLTHLQKSQEWSPISPTYKTSASIYSSWRYWHWHNLIKHVWNCCAPNSGTDVIKVKCRRCSSDPMFNVTLSLLLSFKSWEAVFIF